MKLGVLCSGNLGFQILSKLYNVHKISFVFTNSKSNIIIDFCNKNQIDLFIETQEMANALVL